MRKVFEASLALSLLAFSAAEGQARADDPETEPSPAGPPPPSTAGGSDRNSDSADTPPAAPAVTESQGDPGAAPERSRDDAIFGAEEAAPMFTEKSAPEDPLKIGGMLYLRAQASSRKDQNFGEMAFGTPSIVDLYLDVRPNDRVRGFVLGRLTYDPSSPKGSSGYSSTQLSSPPGSSVAALDQAWLSLDVGHTLFVTAGKQHVRWGTGRFWTPGDYLHLRPRNPLDVFDARTGTSMLKLNLPLGGRAWNLYAYGVTESVDGTPTVNKVAGAARAEVVLGTAELGLGVFARKGTKPKFEGDLSVGIGDFDLHGEVAVLETSNVDRVSYAPDNPVPPPLPEDAPPELQQARLAQVVDSLYPVSQQAGYHAQIVGGLDYSLKYNDKDTLTLGAEYFYNQLGYPDSSVYPGLVLPHTSALSNTALPFYLGRHYAAVYAALPSPFSLDLHSFTLTTLSNVSDRSFVSRLDYSLTVLTHLRFEAFAAVRYGRYTGEFRGGVHPIDLGGQTVSQLPAVFDLGVALRLSL
jgi:hypothetical protein